MNVPKLIDAVVASNPASSGAQRTRQPKNALPAGISTRAGRFVLVWIMIFMLAPACWAQLDTQWVKSFDGPSYDHIYDHIQTSDGGFAFTGMSEDRIAGNNRLWTSKTDSTGELQWSSRLRISAFAAYGKSIFQLQNSEILVFGNQVTIDSARRRTDDIFALRLSSEGDSLSTRYYGGLRNDQAAKAIRLSNSGYAVIGFTDSWGNGNRDYYLLRLDDNCDSLWMRTYGGRAVDECNDIIETSEGGFALAGNTNSFVNGPSSYWVLFTNENGDSLRSFTYNYDDWASCYAKSINEYDDNCYYISGFIRGSMRYRTEAAWTMGIDSSGEILWQRVDGTEGNFVFQSALESYIDFDGNVLITGSSGVQPGGEGFPDGKFWILRLNQDGEGDYLLYIDWFTYVFSRSMTLTRSNEISVAGYYGREQDARRDLGFLLLTTALPNRVIEREDQTITSPTQLNVYPNPFNDNLNIMVNFEPMTIIQSFEILDSFGRTVTRLPASLLAVNSHFIWHPEGLANGQYFISVKTKEQINSLTIILLK